MNQLEKIIQELRASDREDFIDSAGFIVFLYKIDIEQLKKNLGTDDRETEIVIQNIIAISPEKNVSQQDIDNAVAKVTNDVIVQNENMAEFNPASCPSYMVKNGKTIVLALGGTTGAIAGSAFIAPYFIKPDMPNAKALKFLLITGSILAGIWTAWKIWDKQMSRLEKQMGIKVSK